MSENMREAGRQADRQERAHREREREQERAPPINACRQLCSCPCRDKEVYQQI